MPTAWRGADADELERIARTLRSAAAALDGHAGSLTTTLRSVAWVGGVAGRFGAQWNGGHRPRIVSTATYVRAAADQLDRNAAEQRTTSRSQAGGQWAAPAGHPADGSPPAGASSAPHPSDGVPPVPDGASDPGSSPSVAAAGSPTLDRLGTVLRAVGVGRDALQLLGEHADVLEGLGIDELLDVVSNDAFSAVLRGLDSVIDVGDVVASLVIDFAEHPGLPFDERVVHALADAATRFGLDQGAEYAATFLAQAATAALLPGLGAALAPFAGKAAGLVADVVMGEIVHHVDGATDVVDHAADAAVAAYRAIKDTFGVILDAAAGVIDVADAAIDLTGGVGGAVVDAGGAVVAGIADVGSTVGGWLGP